MCGFLQRQTQRNWTRISQIFPRNTTPGPLNLHARYPVLLGGDTGPFRISLTTLGIKCTECLLNRGDTELHVKNILFLGSEIGDVPI